ncbi:MAG: toxin-antitoxin system YwqK family antitoxin [Planctomycetes bacterium]|nr:toxin-antitoxin system YwqK family antitoxin [Planctomycetota bacterium]
MAATHRWEILAATCLACLAGCAAPRGAPGNADRDAGAPITECTGLEVATRETKSDDGTLLRRWQVVQVPDGREVFHGTWTEWYGNGNKKLEIGYDCGVQHGPRRAWFESGEKRSVGGHYYGAGDGVWTEWFPDGTKATEFTMERGAYNGFFTTWHPNGNKRMQVEYVSGVRQGLFTMWDEDGNIVQQLEYRDGKPQPTP